MRIDTRVHSSRVFSINGIKYIRITSKDDIRIDDEGDYDEIDSEHRPRGREA